MPPLRGSKPCGESRFGRAVPPAALTPSGHGGPQELSLKPELPRLPDDFPDQQVRLCHICCFPAARSQQHIFQHQPCLATHLPLFHSRAGWICHDRCARFLLQGTTVTTELQFSSGSRLSHSFTLQISLFLHFFFFFLTMYTGQSCTCREARLEHP